jgi:hypothetical protein
LELEEKKKKAEETEKKRLMLKKKEKELQEKLLEGQKQNFKIIRDKIEKNRKE